MVYDHMFKYDTYYLFSINGFSNWNYIDVFSEPINYNYNHIILVRD